MSRQTYILFVIMIILTLSAVLFPYDPHTVKSLSITAWEEIDPYLESMEKYGQKNKILGQSFAYYDEEKKQNVYVPVEIFIKALIEFFESQIEKGFVDERYWWGKKYHRHLSALTLVAEKWPEESSIDERRKMYWEICRQSHGLCSLKLYCRSKMYEIFLDMFFNKMIERINNKVGTQEACFFY